MINVIVNMMALTITNTMASMLINKITNAQSLQNPFNIDGQIRKLSL